MSTVKHQPIAIIGAGLAGCFLAVTLAKLGYRVQVYESRPDYRKTKLQSDRSFNLTLYYRGIKAMKQMGLWDEVKKIIVPVYGNVVHMPDGHQSYDPYAKTGDEVLYTIHRTKLNEVLLQIAASYKTVSFHFDEECIAIDKTKRTVQFEHTKTKKKTTITPLTVFGADGVHSLVRGVIHDGQESTLSKDRSDWGYKEVRISKELSEQMKLKDNATHTWPKDNSLLLAFPNPDHTFTLMFNLPLMGKDSFESLTDNQSIEAFIQNFFPELTIALPEITDAILTRPTGHFTTIVTEPWYHKDFLVILGDAAHGVMPFYGQGMCSAFEDCLVLSDLTKKHEGNFAEIFPAFQEARKKHTDVLAILSQENFIELRDNARSLESVVTNKVDTLLHTLFPKHWAPPLYKLVAHGDMPYKDAVEIRDRQVKRAKALGIPFVVLTATIPYFLFKKLKK